MDDDRELERVRMEGWRAVCADDSEWYDDWGPIEDGCTFCAREVGPGGKAEAPFVLISVENRPDRSWVNVLVCIDCIAGALSGRGPFVHRVFEGGS